MDYKERLLQLASDYADACAAVQPAWKAMMATAPSSPERLRLRKAYVEASQKAAFLRIDMIRHASRGNSEVGL